jgi:hypothetical protein
MQTAGAASENDDITIQVRASRRLRKEKGAIERNAIEVIISLRISVFCFPSLIQGGKAQRILSSALKVPRNLAVRIAGFIVNQNRRAQLRPCRFNVKPSIHRIRSLRSSRPFASDIILGSCRRRDLVAQRGIVWTAIGDSIIANLAPNPGEVPARLYADEVAQKNSPVIFVDL